MSKSVLLTAATDDAKTVLSELRDKKAEVIHTPLEVYTARDGEAKVTEVIENLDRYENIVYSSERNARFFLEKVKKQDALGRVKDSLNLTFDEGAFSFLEDEGIPAVQPPNGKKPIDLVELMLRLQRMGATLYPCGSHQREDFPGFLEELDMEVTELDLFDLEGPAEHQLAAYRDEVEEKQPDAVIFHSRRSVTRTLAAFPDLDVGALTVISADKGITDKLEEKGIAVDAEAKGNWASIAELV